MTNNGIELKVARTWFGLTHPHGVSTGTHLFCLNNDKSEVYNEMYTSRNRYEDSFLIKRARPFKIGDVISYAGYCDTWYVFDDNHCINITSIGDVRWTKQMKFLGTVIQDESDIDKVCEKLGQLRSGVIKEKIIYE